MTAENPNQVNGKPRALPGHPACPAGSLRVGQSEAAPADDSSRYIPESPQYFGRAGFSPQSLSEENQGSGGLMLNVTVIIARAHFAGKEQDLKILMSV